ncbi:helix-turn-helix domain-containing protein [Streptomyces albireticuli]|uniref:Transcriptional regulator n=1 Tax=Streptomyces albireticuli TaxID=1940 RepID=A0A2A2D8U6_9ACTN|nr:helix-turn-helix transcriptional regulator [Streptomyces albireticuli]MCD9143008.1 helix-turn-helix transcriptional regulator [Streptomyces albireticuli]MCD9165251.1 helix-turn-helix transcriptional regulator [Streptomyces albireticuli]MCD9192232.1 helix-turn-helix transcriptional regulator [Streptomyces albireticuli]PAU47856.1 transcriptional regulator [Streptomyces albireticuli]
MANGRGAGKFGQGRAGWRFFGSELKRWREAAGLTQQELALRVFCSGSYIGQFETGIRRPQPEVAQRIDEELKSDGFFGRMCDELINGSLNVHYFTESAYKKGLSEYFAEAAYLEGLAHAIREYAPVFVPGLLQTEAYARAVFLAGYPGLSDAEIESRVAARLERQGILEDPTKPLLWAVIDENTIRRKVGGASVMSEQLMHVARLARARRITLQVLPFEVAVPALSGSLKLMAFADAPVVAYSEAAHSGGLMDDPARVAALERAYDLTMATALPPAASLELVQSVAAGYASECGWTS